MTENHLQSSVAAIILAAGQSRRMQSSTPKIFHDLAGVTVLAHVLKAVRDSGIEKVVVVAAPSAPDHPSYEGSLVAIQEDAQGTGHAAGIGLSKLMADDPHHVPEDVMILCGDSPLITPETLKALKDAPYDVCMLMAKLPESLKQAPYGRVRLDGVFDGDCHDHPVQGIVEYKDACLDDRMIPWMNPGVYKFKTNLLQTLLPLLSCDNGAKEYYLTDCIALAKARGCTVKAKQVDFDETMGVNTRQDLALLDHKMQNRLKDKLFQSGVTLLQPETIRVHVGVKIGQDTVIEPHVVLGKNVTIGENCRIKSFSYVDDARIDDHVTVGPFAHVRGKSHLMAYSEIGNFVELKKTILGTHSKAKHLTYLGDATVGAYCNVGAGVITANYDGFFKHATVVGDRVSLGAQTVLVAPVTMEDDTMTAAGSVITHTVPKDALALSRTPQENKMGWVQRYRSMMALRKRKAQNPI